jgi:hypothetical protein
MLGRWASSWAQDSAGVSIGVSHATDIGSAAKVDVGLNRLMSGPTGAPQAHLPCGWRHGPENRAMCV